MCPIPAARYTDPIEHTNAMAGFMTGLVAGAAIALLAVAVVGTGGTALGLIAAVGGVMATTGGAAMLGAAIGQMYTTVAGAISATCSTNVKINNLGAARAELDRADCDHHPGQPGQQIATGAATVYINNYPAARKDEALVCGGWISGGSDNVLIGGPSVQLLEINPEIPEWMMTAAQGMALVGGIMAMGAGGLMALGSTCAMRMMLTGLVTGFVGEDIVGDIGGMIGFALDGERGQIAGEMIGEFLGGFLFGALGLRSGRGHPVDVTSGEMFTSHTDFSLPGPLPLDFTRHWMSSSNESGTTGELGHKWSHSLDMRLYRLDVNGIVVMRHEDGHLGVFPIPKRGRPTVNTVDREILQRADTPFGRGYTVTTYGGISYGFAPDPRDRSLFRLYRISDQNGNEITLGRDDRGHLTRIRDSAGRALSVTTERHGWITEIAGPSPDGNGRRTLVSFSYSPNGDLISATDPRGNSLRYDYAAHLLIRETRRGGLVYHFRWDDPTAGTRARCLETWGESAQAGIDNLHYARFDFDPDKPVTRVTDAADGVVLYEYNAHGKVTRQVDPAGVETRWSYDFADHETSMRDDLGRAQVTEYDEWQRVIAIKPRNAEMLSYRYGSDDPLSPLFGVATQITSGEGPSAAVERLQYDPRGNLVSVTDAIGQEQRVLRDARGLPVATLDALGTRWRWQWDGAGQMIAQGPDRLTNFYMHDALGRIIHQRDNAEKPTRFEYDPNGNVTAIITGDGRRATMEYDADDQMIRHCDPMGRVTQQVFAGLSRPIARIDAEDTRVDYRYDHEMRLLAVRNGVGNVTEIRYDQLGQKVYERSFDGTVLRSHYDSAGYLSQLDGPGGTTLAKFDRVGQLISRVCPDGTHHEFEYSRAGALTAFVADGRRTELRYDALGRCIAEIGPSGTTSYEFDIRDNLIATILPDGEVIRQSYRPDGAIAALKLEGQEIAAWSYAQTGELAERRQAGTKRSFTWDADGRPLVDQLTRVARHGPDMPQTVVARRFEWNADNSLNAVEDSRRGARHFRYDPAKRLIGVDGPLPERMRYDRAGNLTALARSQSDLALMPDSDPARASLGFTATARGDRIYPGQDARLVYDAAGNVTEITAPGSRLVMDYGDVGMLTRACRESHGRRITSVYRYDAFARRVAKHVLDEQLDDAGQVIGRDERSIAFTWDGDRLIAEGPAEGDHFARLYFYEADGITPLAFADRQPDGSRRVFYCNTDLVGQPMEVVDAAGDLVWAAQYTAYGVALADAGDGFHQPIRFPGQYHDPETGLHYNRNRYYMPQFGRYSQPDPIGLDGGLNAYFYPANPTLLCDPLGLTQEDKAAAKERRLGVIRFDKETTSPIPGARDTAKKRFWRLERRLVISSDYRIEKESGSVPNKGYGTREWTPKEKRELLERGRVSGYDADHINNAEHHPEWRADPRNIQALPNSHHPTLGFQHRFEARRGHNGNTQIPKTGQLIDQAAMIERNYRIANQCK